MPGAISEVSCPCILSPQKSLSPPNTYIQLTPVQRGESPQVSQIILRVKGIMTRSYEARVAVTEAITAGKDIWRPGAPRAGRDLERYQQREDFKEKEGLSPRLQELPPLATKQR